MKDIYNSMTREELIESLLYKDQEIEILRCDSEDDHCVIMSLENAIENLVDTIYELNSGGQL